jgi:simple sugar transport system ATP-binding protein
MGASEHNVMAGSPPAVRMENITKRFGQLAACDDVSIDLHAGRIHGVLGQNGAGKSTLMKILIGLVPLDAGTIAVDGQPVRITDPQVAASLRIGMVHQHFSLVDALSVWENILLGDRARLDRKAARDQVVAIGERYGLTVDPDAEVGHLTAGQRQRVEIIKCLRRDPRILIFDEPTSVLTPAESEQLFGVLRAVVRDQGHAVALVSHKLDEIMQATDDLTIMRDGRVVERLATRDADPRSLARAMVGRDVTLRSDADGSSAGREPSSKSGAAALEVHDVTITRRDGSVALDHLSLSVTPGEIVGVAGVEGNGQRELGDLLSSLLVAGSGSVSVSGRNIPTGKPGAMSASGVAVIPEDRHDSGCVLGMTVAENLVLARPDLGHRSKLIDRGAIVRNAESLIAEFDIQCGGPDAPMWSLSGGNQQRVVLAREMSNAPVVVVACQPTRGLDVGAIEYMSARLRQAADDGVGVLLISSELDELMALSDRIVVMYRGRIVGEMARADVDMERLGMLMGGVTA